MSHKVLLATNNAKKLSELRRIVAQANLDVEIVCLRDIDAYPEPDETEWTFEGNALIKARAGALHSGLPALADDSGLCVDALNQMPGVRSSRWAGSNHDDQANLDLVLRQIEDVPEGRRQASFVSVVALVMPDGREFTTTGRMTGRLTFEPCGVNGFGYDPIFVADEFDLDQAGQVCTTAQIAAEEKDAISHRGKALRQMMPLLAQALDDSPADR